MYTHIAHTELKKKPNNQMQKTNQKQNGVQKTRAHVKRDGVKDERFQPKTNYYNGTIHNNPLYSFIYLFIVCVRALFHRRVF